MTPHGCNNNGSHFTLKVPITYMLNRRSLQYTMFIVASVILVGDFDHLAFDTCYFNLMHFKLFSHVLPTLLPLTYFMIVPSYVQQVLGESFLPSHR